ncbi:MAG TPA: ROK family protein [Pirellulales bacterium]|nr:ROK family protein [Pirellulales bacterium]
MFLGIESGGTKLQLGVGRGDGAPMIALERLAIDPAAGNEGILRQIAAAAPALITRHRVTGIGVGFGGPVDSEAGRLIKSHQIEGWDNFELARWCQEKLGLPTRIENDCDAAALAEARFGAGRGQRVVFYVTVGTGVGGGLVIDGQIFHGQGLGVAEIGHLRPGLHADRPDETIESIASGWGIADLAQSRIADPATQPLIPLASRRNARRPEAVRQWLATAVDPEEEFAADLRSRAGGQIEQLTAKIVAEAAADGNGIAREVLEHACRVLGWGIAQVITLISPGVVVVGGGVSLMDESLFFAPLRREVERYVFPPQIGSYRIEPAALGELVVVHGALAAARQAMPASTTS